MKSVDGRETILRESTIKEETDGREADIDSLTDNDHRRRAIKTGSLSSLYRREREKELARLKELEEERLRLEKERREQEIAFRDRNLDLMNKEGEEEANLSPKLKRKDRHPSYTRLNPDWWKHDDDRQMIYDPETDTYSYGPRGSRRSRQPISAADWKYPGSQAGDGTWKYPASGGGGTVGEMESYNSSAYSPSIHNQTYPRQNSEVMDLGSYGTGVGNHVSSYGDETWKYPANGGPYREVHSAKFESSAVEEKIFVPSPMEESFIAPPKAINVRPRDESEISTEQKPLLNTVDAGEEQKAQFMYYRLVLDRVMFQ